MTHSSYWPRAIILVDMNAFFASIEQLDHPEWRGLPVAVTNGEQGTCIITCSYEARAYGIKTGMRLVEAKQRCPRLIRCPSRPKRYTEISRRIMQGLRDMVPDMEVFSVDEAFLEVTRYQKLYGLPPEIGQQVKQRVFELSGLHCSVGVSGDKTTAKFAAKCQKPDGFTVIPPWQAKERLRHVPVSELCGIGPGITRFLARYGVIHCGDMERIPIGVLAKRFGNLGRRLWFMCQGADPAPLTTTVAAPKSMGHGKVMPPHTRCQRTLLVYFRHMSEKLAARLRRNHLQAQHFFLGLRQQQGTWLKQKTALAQPTDDGQVIFQACQHFVSHCWQQQPVCQVQVTALDPKPSNHQLDFLTQTDPRRQQLNQAMDNINQRYGEFTLAPARLLQRSSMHNVIAPAWQPEGHRQTIEE